MRAKALLVLLLAGCAPTLAEIRPAKLDQGDFLGTLAREQRRHAIFLGRQGSTILEAERFAKKADAARDGAATEPEPAGTAAMAAARARLLSLLGGPARDRCPVFAALALSRYDAWAERHRAWPDGEEAQRLQREFEANAAALEGLCARTG